jgi:RNA polymerase sigma-B factor
MRTLSPKSAAVARERLVESHLPLVRSVARRYIGRGESLDDLVQVGAIGLVKAGNRFDRNRGVAFATFAAPVIEGEIRRHLRDKSSFMRIPREAQRARGELGHQRGELAAALGRSPTTAELAAALDVDEESFERALRAELARESVPLSQGAESGRFDDSDQHRSSEDRLTLSRCMGVLDERERKLVFLRFFADMTERQIGRELGVSQAQVSRLLSAALARLHAELASANSDSSVADTTMKSAISPASRGKRTQGGGRKGADAPASQETLDVEHYLGLPYTVAVQSETAAVQSEGKEPRWSATVDELPGCASQGRTPDEAVERLRGAMESWLSAALAQRREIPVPGDRTAKPRATSSHSGRFLVRMPGALHAQLAGAAEREHLSLNRFVVNALTASLGSTAAAQPSPDVEPPGEAVDRQAAARGKPSRALRLALLGTIALVVVAAAAALVLLVLALQRGV